MNRTQKIRAAASDPLPRIFSMPGCGGAPLPRRVRASDERGRTDPSSRDHTLCRQRRSEHEPRRRPAREPGTRGDPNRARHVVPERNALWRRSGSPDVAGHRVASPHACAGAGVGWYHTTYEYAPVISILLGRVGRASPHPRALPRPFGPPFGAGLSFGGEGGHEFEVEFETRWGVRSAVGVGGGGLSGA